MPVAACATQIKYVPATCAVYPGGVAQVFTFDPTVFDFTSGSPTPGGAAYTAITDLGTGSLIYGIKFTRMQAQYEFDQKNADGIAPTYNHKWTLPVADINQLTKQWSTLIDAQGYCCGIGIITVLNSGRILIGGENSVDTAALAVPFYVYQDGSKATSGKKMEDQNQNTVQLIGQYNRPLVEYTGTLASLLAFAA
jgi:hypothetical protein